MDIILVLLVILVIIAALIAALLFIPIDISLRLLKKESLTQIQVSFNFLRGAASGHLHFGIEKREFLLKILGLTLLRRDLEEREKKDEKPPNWGKMIQNADELYSAGMELFRAFSKSLSLRRVGGKMKVGLPNPSDTGILTGFLYAGSGILKAFIPESSLEIEPSFKEERLDADLELNLNLPLYKILIPLIRVFRRTGNIR